MNEQEKMARLSKVIAEKANELQIDYASFTYFLAATMSAHAKSNADEGQALNMIANAFLISGSLLNASPDIMVKYAAKEAKVFNK